MVFIKENSVKRKVAFVFGGKSVEHEISIITGLQAYHAFDNDTYDAFVLYLSKENEFYVGKDLEEIENYRDMNSLLSRVTKVILVNDNGVPKLVSYPPKKFGKNFEQQVDLAFLCVHGTNVEDGALQGFFQTLGLEIVGCDVESAALGMDKFSQKAILRDAGVPTLEAKRYTYKDYEDIDSLVSDVETTFGYPVIIKPVDLGSSVGINVAKDKASLIDAIDEAFRFASLILAEHAISNLREINCAVLGDIESAQASEIEEPISSDEILSYEDKYMSGSKGGPSKGMASVSRQIPANVTSEVREEIRELAIRAFQALGCSGVARIDFLIDVENDNKIYFNEINTIPGSLSFYLWEPLGKPYSELLGDMIEIARIRERRRAALTFTFSTNVLDSASLKGSKGK